MKIEQLAFAIAGETLEVLESKYHYRIPEEHKRDVQRSVQERLNEILKKAANAPMPEAEAAKE